MAILLNLVKSTCSASLLKPSLYVYTVNAYSVVRRRFSELRRVSPSIDIVQG